MLIGAIILKILKPSNLTLIIIKNILYFIFILEFSKVIWYREQSKNIKKIGITTPEWNLYKSLNHQNAVYNSNTALKRLLKAAFEL